MPRHEGWSEEELERRSGELAALLQKIWAAVAALISTSITKRGTVTASDAGEVAALWLAQQAPVVAEIAQAYVDAAGAVIRTVDPAGVHDLELVGEDLVTMHVDEATNRLKGISDEVWQVVRAQIIEGLNAGESVPQVAARVQQATGVTTGRAMTIARTEMHAAHEAGSLDQAMFVDPSATKEWLATRDDRTRETHKAVDGKKIKISEPFQVGSALLMVPGVPLGELADPGEIINCRCSVAYDFDIITTETSDQGPEVSVPKPKKPGMAALAAAAAKWKPEAHPRGKDGKFIEKGAIQHLLTAANPLISDVSTAVAELDDVQWSKLTDDQKQYVKDSVAKLPAKSSLHKAVSEKIANLEGEPAPAAAPAAKPAIPPNVGVNDPLGAGGNPLTGSNVGYIAGLMSEISSKPADFDDAKPVQEGKHALYTVMASVPFKKGKGGDPEWRGTRTYQSMIAERWNKALREGKPFEGTDEEKKRVADAQVNLDALLAKSSTLQTVRVWRGIKDYDKSIEKTLKKGTVFEDKGYVSTSTERSVGENFGGHSGLLFDIEVPAGSRAVVPTQWTTRFLEEWEVTLPRGSRFEVIEEPKTVDGQRIVKVRAVTDVDKAGSSAPAAPEVAAPVAVAAHKSAAPGSPAKITTTLVWGKHPTGTVVLDHPESDQRVVWDGKKYVIQSKISTGDWVNITLHSKKSFYDEFKNDTGWVVPGAEPFEDKFLQAESEPFATDAELEADYPMVLDQHKKGLITTAEFEMLTGKTAPTVEELGLTKPAVVNGKTGAEWIDEFKNTGQLSPQDHKSLVQALTQDDWDGVHSSFQKMFWADVSDLLFDDPERDALLGKLLALNHGKTPGDSSSVKKAKKAKKVAKKSAPISPVAKTIAESVVPLTTPTVPGSWLTLKQLKVLFSDTDHPAGTVVALRYANEERIVVVDDPVKHGGKSYQVQVWDPDLAAYTSVGKPLGTLGVIVEVRKKEQGWSVPGSLAGLPSIDEIFTQSAAQKLAKMPGGAPLAYVGEDVITNWSAVADGMYDVGSLVAVHSNGKTRIVAAGVGDNGLKLYRFDRWADGKWEKDFQTGEAYLKEGFIQNGYPGDWLVPPLGDGFHELAVAAPPKPKPKLQPWTKPNGHPNWVVIENDGFGGMIPNGTTVAKSPTGVKVTFEGNDFKIVDSVSGDTLQVVGADELGDVAAEWSSTWEVVPPTPDVTDPVPAITPTNTLAPSAVFTALSQLTPTPELEGQVAAKAKPKNGAPYDYTIVAHNVGGKLGVKLLAADTKNPGVTYQHGTYENFSDYDADWGDHLSWFAADPDATPVTSPKKPKKTTAPLTPDGFIDWLAVESMASAGDIGAGVVVAEQAVKNGTIYRVVHNGDGTFTLKYKTPYATHQGWNTFPGGSNTGAYFAASKVYSQNWKWDGVTNDMLDDEPDLPAPTYSLPLPPSPTSAVGDISHVSWSTKNVMKSVLKDDKIGYWSKPEKIWDAVKKIQAKYPDFQNPGHSTYTPLQIFKILDSTLKTKDPSPFETKMVKWAATAKGAAYIGAKSGDDVKKLVSPTPPAAPTTPAAPAGLPTATALWPDLASKGQGTVLFSGSFGQQSYRIIVVPGANGHMIARLQSMKSAGSWINVKTYPYAEYLQKDLDNSSYGWVVGDGAYASPLGGSSDISSIFDATKQSLYATFKQQPATYLTSESSDIYAAAKTIADDQGITLLQMLRVVDEVGAKKVNKPDEHLFEKKIVDWLKSPKGAAVASGKPIPLPDTPKYAKGVTNQVGTFESTGIYSYNIITVAQANSLWPKFIAGSGGDWTTTQRNALRTYTGGTYYSVNAYLYGKLNEVSTTHANVIKNAQAGMRPSTVPMLLHRGVGFGGIANANSHAQLEKAVGSTWKSGGFFSTSVAGQAAFSNHSVHVEVEAPPGTPMAWVKPISLHPGENEMLLAAGLNYRIISVTKVGAKSVVRVRVVP